MAESINAQLTKIFNDIIKLAVKRVFESKEFKERFHKHMMIVIDDVVYSYDAMYPEYRRKEDGGLQDKRNLVIEFETESLNTISYTITNITEDKANYNYYRPVGDVVETGKGYTWNIGSYGNHSMQPRPFMKVTAEQRLYVKDFIELLQSALAPYGISIK